MDSERTEDGGVQVNIIIQIDDKIDWTHYEYKDGKLKRR